ncbi:NADH-quinone oxidoreductase subunit N [Actinomycetospora lutea]|uniref:NADH-quinone oxidoreductase subunit N n=1 Tax=Actinomycetospora lutea TaxID=663604 RepID=UPI002365DDEC|nr:NADH-quinone oxidoreductase subunit N [Actinomycetospora lutea]MDD7942691.1 NADH-quinone oxidoreductase subunit N [Actinomycetospora lutea]
MMNEDPTTVIPELALLVGAVLAVLVGAWTPRRRQGRVRVLALLAVGVGLIATVIAASEPPSTTFDTYVLDTTTHAVRAIVLVSLALILWWSRDAVAAHPRESEFTALVLLGGLGAVLMAGAADLLMLFAAFLLASVPLYALAGWAKTGATTEAALKYYLSGAFAGVTMLAGITLLYGAAGTTGYEVLAEGLVTGAAGPAAVGLVALLAGLAFKAGAVPAHFWVPDVTDGTPPPVAAVLTTIPKIGALAAMWRLLLAVPEAIVPWPLLVAVIAAISMTLGNLAAFAQASVLRLLAYSTVSQVGYILVIIAVGARTPEALPALLFYLAAYALTNIGAFAVVAAHPARTIDEFRGLGRRRPLLAIALVVSLLGLVGTPPTAVFVGKLTAFTAAFDGGMAWLAVLAAVNTVASLFYYLRWIAPLFRDEQPEPPQENESRTARHGAVAASALSLLLGVAAGLVLPLFATM